MHSYNVRSDFPSNANPSIASWNGITPSKMAEEELKGQEKPDEAKKHLGIPEAVFLDDVESMMKAPENTSVQDVIKRMDEQYQKYRFMEANLVHKKRRLRGQLPDIKKTLEAIVHLKEKKTSSETSIANFVLSDNVYAVAEVPPTDTVYLWLGANVMLEYSIDEAESLLRKNQEAASTNLKQAEADMDFLREQITTMEVNMARVYNWDVQKRKQKKS